MGGSAFAREEADSLLSIVRLSPRLHAILTAAHIELFSHHFANVCSPRSCPWKSSHGDVDIICSSPASAESMIDLANLTGATCSVQTGPTTHLAVPLDQKQAALNGDINTLTFSSPAHYQLDIVVCQPQHFPWLSFRHEYSVPWSILGSILRPSGLTPNEVGLHLRMAELEARDRKASMIFLSSNPRSIVKWLGMDWDAWEVGFTSQQELYDWIGTCRLLTAKENTSSTVLDEMGSGVLDFTSTSADRRNMIQRPGFREFFEIWIPAHHAELTSRNRPSREEVLQDAITTFAKTSEYHERHGEAIKDNLDILANAKLLKAMEHLNLKQDKLNLIVRAVKRWVLNPSATDPHAHGPNTSAVTVADTAFDQPRISPEVAVLALRQEPEMDLAAQMRLGSILTSDHESLDTAKREWILTHVEDLRTLEKGRMSRDKAARKQLMDQAQSESQASEEMARQPG